MCIEIASDLSHELSVCETCRKTLASFYEASYDRSLLLKAKQTMTPVIAPCEPPYSAGVTDDLAALMPPGIPPIALFRVLAHNPAGDARFVFKLN